MKKDINYAFFSFSFFKKVPRFVDFISTLKNETAKLFMRVKHQLEPMFSLCFYTLTSVLIPANGPLKSTFAHTCCLIQGLLLQTDCGLKLRVNTSRNEG